MSLKPKIDGVEQPTTASDPARCVAEFLDSATKIRDQWRPKPSQMAWLPWFRGHADESWKLQPVLYRPLSRRRSSTTVDPILADALLRAEFKRRGGQFTTEKPKDRWEWYFLMQHYGAPTRLLDWTDGALIALYFAVRPHVESDLYEGINAAVWVLDPYELNDLSLENPHRGVLASGSPDTRPYLPETGNLAHRFPNKPIAIDPPHVARRLAVQRSRFVMFGYDEHGIENLMGNGKRLVKIVVASEMCETIYRDLQTCGVSQSTLFPDLEGLAGELARAWRVNSFYR